MYASEMKWYICVNEGEITMNTNDISGVIEELTTHSYSRFRLFHDFRTGKTYRAITVLCHFREGRKTCLKIVGHFHSRVLQQG